MIYKSGILILSALYAYNVEALPPCVCTRNLRPVCGSDGVTYSNECVLNCERTKTNPDLKLAKDGPCAGDPLELVCICTQEYNPVCGANGQTYSNPCTADCNSVEIAHHGDCSVNVPCICSKESKPVCGSNGVTYGNACMLNCATGNDSTLAIAKQGPCESDAVKVVDDDDEDDDCECARIHRPVCGSDGVTYGNRCLLKCAGKQEVTDGPCEEPGTVVKVVDGPSDDGDQTADLLE